MRFRRSRPVWNEMKALMFSRDVNIFKKESAVRARMVEYGALFDRLHVCVVSSGTYREEYISSNVRVFQVPFLSFIDANKVLKKIPTGVDMVTAQDPFETGHLAYRVAEKLSVPFQLQVHTDFLSPLFKRGSFKNRIRCVIADKIISKASCIRVVSARIKDSVQSQVTGHGSRITVLPIFIDAQKIQNAAPAAMTKDGCTVLWVGRLEREKNCALAIEAFSKFLERCPDARLIVVGDGSEREKLELQAARRKLEAHVSFLGWRDDIFGYYKSADVLLVTSLYEGYGMNMVEARIAGMSVVAPDVGVAREIGAHVVVYSADAFAETLGKLYRGELPKTGEYEYPYKDKREYLRAYKQSFEQCLPENQKI